MDIKNHTTPAKLEYYAFMWSEVRLFVAALALFLGGYPPIIYFLPIPGLYGLLYVGLKLAWLVSGIAAAYLLYRWHTGGQKLFGSKDTKDTVAFMVMCVSGINLGLVGVLGTNIGMSITSNYIVFVIASVAYLTAAYHLYNQWKAYGRKVF
jgi:hypothetical protein